MINNIGQLIHLSLGNLFDLSLQILNQAGKVQPRQTRLERSPNVRSDSHEPEVHERHERFGGDGPPAEVLVQLERQEEEVGVHRQSGLEGRSPGRLGSGGAGQGGQGCLEGEERCLESRYEGFGQGAFLSQSRDTGG